MIITLPNMNIRAFKKNDGRYVHEVDIASWIFLCADECTKKNVTPEVAAMLNGIARTILTAEEK